LFNYDNITIVGILYCCLNVIEIRRAIVIDGDYFRLTGNDQKQAYKGKNQVFHVNLLFSAGFYPAQSKCSFSVRRWV
jgi:hypothetical protein